MGGRPADWVVCKPSRSDEVIPPEEQLRTAREVQAHFDSMAPKRPQKPNRSEASTAADDSPPDAIHPIHDPPELEKLQTLRTESHVSSLLSLFVPSVPRGTSMFFVIRLDPSLKSVSFFLQTILADGRVYSMEEFVETDYYKRLNSIDKNHFTARKTKLNKLLVHIIPKFFLLFGILSLLPPVCVRVCMHLCRRGRDT